MRYYFAAAAALITLWFWPGFASAQTSQDMTVCNRSPNELKMVIGFYTPGVGQRNNSDMLTGPLASKGWYVVQPGACRTFSNQFHGRYMYWWGFTNTYNNGLTDTGWWWEPEGTRVALCIPDTRQPTLPAFTYEAENVMNPPACRKLGKNVWVFPQVVDTWVSPSVTFTGQ